MRKGGASGSGSENRAAYLRMSVTVLAAFCRVPEIASSEDMVSEIPLMLEIMSKEPSVPEECYEFLFLGVDRMLAKTGFRDYGSQSVEFSMRLVRLVISTLSLDAISNEYPSELAVMVAAISKQFAVLHNALKFEALRLLSVILSSVYSAPLHEALRSMNDDVWSTFIRVGVAAILQNRVAPAEKIQGLILAESVMSMVGEGWLIGQMNLSNAVDPVPADVFYEVEKQADWSAYREYCCTQGLKYPLLAKRLACMVMSGVANADSLDILQPAILSPEMILQMEKEFTLLRSAFEEAYVTDEQMAFLTKQWYIAVLARIRINAFRIELAGGLYDYQDPLSSAPALVDAEAAVGNAVYMLPSFYNHDCKGPKLHCFNPNAHIVWIENSDARVKALRDIEAGLFHSHLNAMIFIRSFKGYDDYRKCGFLYGFHALVLTQLFGAAGEELRICYIDASMDHDARQRLLSEGFGFRCQCLRCLLGD
ncbi:hypothetical protein C3L33_04625, partial [Rhododendron williamsianum]